MQMAKFLNLVGNFCVKKKESGKYFCFSDLTFVFLGKGKK